MDNIIQNLSGHPFAVSVIIFMTLLVLYFFFKQLIKMALLFFLIILALCGYFYFKDPHKAPENIKETLGKAKMQTEKMVEKGKDAYQTGKEVVEKGKKLTEGMDNLFVGKEKKTDKMPERGP
jgi:Ca2+-dependent lipid-binding protein